MSKKKIQNPLQEGRLSREELHTGNRHPGRPEEILEKGSGMLSRHQAVLIARKLEQETEEAP